MNGNDITGRFSIDQVDHHELLQMLSLRYGTSWRVSDREITLPAAHEYALRLKIRHGRVEKIFAGSALSRPEFDELLDQLHADLFDERIAEFGVEVLFAPKPVEGSFRFSSLPMQILPPRLKQPGPRKSMLIILSCSNFRSGRAAPRT